MGFLINLSLPPILARVSISVFIKLYKIDPSGASKEISQYRCIGEFFTRDLKPEQRPINSGLVSPVDGTLRSYQDKLEPGGRISQVKGRDFLLSELLANDPLVDRFSQAQLWNIYLSPSDVHHIFSPVAGRIFKTVHIPGRLWPVNDWALANVERLFAVNERVVTFIDSGDSGYGLVCVVMVGATNVGRIALTYTDVETNLKPWQRRSVRAIEHVPPVVVNAGDKIGTFKMGSSVLVLTECGRELQGDRRDSTVCLRKLVYGERL